MADIAKIEEYFEGMGFSYVKPKEDVWIGKIDKDDPNMIIAYAPPVVILRMKLMEVPETEEKEKLFRLLLEINATEMDHGAFGIEENNITLVDTLQVENLDMNELQASIDSLYLAASMAYTKLIEYREQ